MEDLKALRKEINSIDEKLLTLFLERLYTVEAIYEEKTALDLKITDTKREEEIFNNLEIFAYEEAKQEAIIHYFKAILEISKKYQGSLAKRSYGLLGKKLSHSLSPKIHDLFFEIQGISSTYDLIETSPDELEEYIKTFKGLNVTIPYKETVIPYLEELSREAELIGAVNTIYKNKGYNTDYYGFKQMMKVNSIDVKQKKVIILGTGGASKAVYAYVKDAGAKEILFASRSKTGKQFINYTEEEKFTGDVIINTTPVGMHPKESSSPVSKVVVGRFNAAVDLIYNPEETKFLKYAKDQGLNYTNGFYMLVAQAIKAEEIWQERSIDDEIIMKIYKKLK